jgi:hypothetical protein
MLQLQICRFITHGNLMTQRQSRYSLAPSSPSRSTRHPTPTGISYATRDPSAVGGQARGQGHYRPFLSIASDLTAPEPGRASPAMSGRQVVTPGSMPFLGGVDACCRRPSLARSPAMPRIPSELSSLSPWSIERLSYLCPRAFPHLPPGPSFPLPSLDPTADVATRP